MSENYDKKLQKNYGKVQKSELKYFEKKDKVLSSYDRKLKSIDIASKKDEKNCRDTEKEIDLKSKAELQEIKLKEKEQKAQIDQKLKNAQAKLKTDADLLEQQNKETLAVLVEQKKDLTTENTTKKREDAQKHKKVQTSIKGKEKRTNKRFEGMKSKEKDVIKERKKEAELKIKSLETERDTLVKELSDTSQQEINSAYEVISFRRAKTDELIAKAEEKHKELIASIEKEEQGATTSYNGKIQKNEIALEEKVARRNKFLKKADVEGDFKNVKLQKREIKQLEQSSDKELKQINLEYDKLIKEIEMKRTFEERRYLEEVAELERNFAQFKQEQLWRVELLSIETSEKITNIKLETEKKLFAENLLLQNIDIDFEAELGRLEKEKQLAINELQDQLFKVNIQYGREKDTNALVYDMSIAQNDKDVTITKLEKDIKRNEINANLDIAQVEYEIALQMLEEELNYSKIKSTEEQYLAKLKVDFEKQKTIREEYTESVNELANAHQERIKELLDFEEIEIENRFQIKREFLENQKDILQEEYKLLLANIEKKQKQEEAFFKTAIKEIEKQEKSILKKTVAKETREIKKLESQLAEIEAQEEEIDSSVITSKLQELIDCVTLENEKTQKLIDAKIRVIHENIALNDARKEQEKDDAKTLFNREVRNLDYAIELLEQNEKLEKNEAEDRYEKSLKLYTDLQVNMKNQMIHKKEEHIAFLNRRTEYENNIINTAKQSYEKAMELLEETQLRKISSIKDGLQSENKALHSLIDEQKQTYDALQKESVHKKAMIHNNAEAMLLEHENQNEKRVKEIESNYQSIVAKKEKDLREQDNEFKSLIAQLEKSIQVEKKKYEDDRRKAQKAYEIELKKSIATINKKLDLESRLV